MMDNIDNALAKLRENKLVVEQKQRPRPEILGGSKRATHLGITVYSDAFTITPENNVWVVRTSGGGQQVNEFIAIDLCGAVDFVIEHYKTEIQNGPT